MLKAAKNENRLENGRRLQSGSGSSNEPEAALSGSIPHRPSNTTETAEMLVQQDTKVVQSEIKIKNRCLFCTQANHCKTFEFTTWAQ